MRWNAICIVVIVDEGAREGVVVVRADLHRGGGSSSSAYDGDDDMAGETGKEEEDDEEMERE